ncbi:MAG: hypothetical protein ABJF10_00735 [Chthoniobacter sp.]|uniref:ABC transporter permease n=1 Tax=Chthoniobacter sp. TaxID=2510640 RepID=UPI0032A2FE92
MSSPLLALFVRSLREDSRLKFTYFARAGLVSVILLFLFMTQSNVGWTNAPGLRFFETVISVDLVFVLLAGVSYFSSAISEEKEEMTLGLLRMTNLDPLSILLGKSTSRLCTAVLLFAAQLPFTLLAVTLGGVSLHQIFAAYLAIGAFIVFISNLALLASVLSRRASGSAVLTGVSLLFFFIVVPFAAWLGKLPLWLGILKEGNAWTVTMIGIAEFATEASPFVRAGKILSTGFVGDLFTFQVWSNLAMGLVLFLGSWALFEKFCGEQKESAPTRAGVTSSPGRRRALFSPGRPWKRALAWKDFYFTTGGKLWIFIKLLVYGTPLLVIRCWPHQLGGPPRWRDFGVGTFWIMLGFICIELAFAAATIFRNEHQGQTLSSLAMLPQGLRRVAYEKLLGVLPALFAAGAYFALSIPLIARLILDTFGQMNSNDAAGWMFMTFFLTQTVLFLHLVVALSLYVKRGALPLAIGVHFLLGLLMSVVESVLFRDVAGFYVLIFLSVGASAFLHLHIIQRLETLAAEE